MACPGSILLCAKVAPEGGAPSEYAAEGTVAHRLAERYVSGVLDYLDLMMLVRTTEKQDGYDVTITDEMVDAVTVYGDLIAADKKAMEGRFNKIPPELKLEVKARMSKDVWGTSDAVLYQKGNALIVYDFKYGKGVAVGAKENSQLAIYALGVMQDPAVGDVFDTVELVIVQPRTADPIRRWPTTLKWLRTFAATVEEKVTQTQDGSALRAGEWCRFCPAGEKAECPELALAVEREAQADFAVAPTAALPLPAVDVMPIARIARALDWQDLVEGWFAAVRERALLLLSQGVDVPGFKMVEGKTNRKWVDEGRVVNAYGGELGDMLWEKSILSPARLEKMLGKSRKGELESKGLTEKPEGKKTIVRDSDPRPVAQSTAADDFREPAKAIWP